MSLVALTITSINGNAADGLPSEPGVHDVEIKLNDGSHGRFTLSLPAAYDGSDKVKAPLVLVLHYAGQPTRFYGRPLVELFAPAWQELGAIFLAPESRDGQWSSEANEAFVLNLLETMQSHYPVDAERVVVTGYSMGAIGSWHMIMSHPERFSAALPVAGMSNGPLECPVPVLSLATRSDEIFDFERLAAAVDNLKQQGCAVELREVAARGHYDIGGFAGALREAVPWLKSVWANSAP